VTCRPRLIARSTPDPALIERFYRALLGWSPVAPDAHGRPGRTYGPGEATAVLVEGPRASPWRTFFSTADPDAVIQRALAAGGGVLASELIAGAQEISDRSGDVFGILAGSGRDPAEPREMGLGAAELASLEPRAAAAFLADVLAAPTHAVVGDPYDLQLLLDEGELVTSVFKRIMFDLPTWVPYIRVRDVRVVTARATELGARAVIPPAPTPTGAQAIITDPDDVVIGLQEFPYGAEDLRRLVDPDRAATTG
jgi:predicted enzyme related to lactoylglutathione lyase